MTEDELRAELAASLRPAEPWPGAPSPEVIAGALLPRFLPVVRRYAARQLRDAADAIDGDGSGGFDAALRHIYAAGDLRVRADTIEADR